MPATCKCCGSKDHKKEDCPQNHYHCPTCKKQGHLETLCWYQGQAPPKAASDQPPGTIHLGGSPAWCCCFCSRWMTDDQPKCTGCKRKRPDQAEAKAAAAAAGGETTNQKKEKDDELVQNWSTNLPSDGAQRIAPLSAHDQAQADQVEKMEKLIEILKSMEGKEEEVKKLEAEITVLIKKKLQTRLRGTTSK